MSVSEALQLSAFALGGAALGVAYFMALRRNVALYLQAGPRWPAVIVHLARVAAAAGVFVLAAKAGAGPLLAAAAGFAAARLAVIRFARRAPC